MAGAVAAVGAAVEVVVAGRHDAHFERDDVAFHFVAERRRPRPRAVLGHRAAPHPRRSLAAAARLRADVIHLHGLSFPRQARGLRRAHADVPLLGQDHADRAVGGWRRLHHARGLTCLDAVAFTHRGQARPFVDAGLLREDVRVVEVPEGSSTFTPGDRAAAQTVSGVHGSPAVVWVGKLVDGKDPVTALDAFAEIDGADARLWMVHQGGDLEAAVARRIQDDVRLRGRVRRLGAVPHVRMESLLRAADALLATSRREGGAYTVLEALACGTPVVASDILAHRALLGTDPPGALAAPGDATALARALREVVGRRDHLGAAARARFETALSWAVVGRTLLAAYVDLVAARTARR
jgi:glycosyltransferase involved in cell wall biosynthesis